MTDSAEQITEGVEPAGKFRLYLGAAAGVGKTCAMLDEGRRRAERGTDIVVGFVEAHGRPFTLQAVDGLEVIPRKKVTYRGAEFEEMDTRAVIERHPKVALVDELAHTNVPGSGPHEKRWQDVLDLLEEGISVISTVNVQHLESIADSVERMTGTKVRERLPDWVVRRADQLELIDSSPEQLRRRMAHGNIYPTAKAPSALANFFRIENLTALRELALRFVADEADDDLLARLHGQPRDEVWDVTERILVAVDATSGTDGVMRRAARIALRVKADLHVVHIKSSETSGSKAREGIAQLRRLAEDLGGDWIEIDGDDLAKTLIDYAASHQITQVVLGSSRRSRFEELTRGSIVSKVIRLASVSDVDVHVIARRDVDGRYGQDRGRFASVHAGEEDDDG
jgi:two-component system sensor histidine kinase KdpD